MADSRKMSSKELLAQDPFFTFWEKAVVYIQENRQRLMALGLVIVVAAAGTGLWKVRQSRLERESLNMFYTALRTMQNSSRSQDPAVGYENALASFLDLADTYAGTQAGKAALYYAAACTYRLNRYDEAVERYRLFLSKAGDALSYLRPFALAGIGYAYEARGEYSRAIEWFEKQRDDTSVGRQPLALLSMARCYEAQGNSAQACSLYKTFLEQQPSSSFRELAKAKTALLCAEG